MESDATLSETVDTVICSVINVACQFNPVSRSYPVVSGLPPSTDGGCFGRCAGFHEFSC